MATENKFINVAYKLYTIEDGEKELVEEATAKRPFQFISGLGSTLEAFETQVAGLNKGDHFDFVIDKGDAYGEYDDAHVLDLDKKVFEIDGHFDSKNITAGAVVPLMDNEGHRMNGVIVEVKDASVTVDLNHPLAGADLNFIGEVTEMREATKDEIQSMINMMSGSGCSCGCGGDCDCGEEGCGDSCGEGCGHHCH